MLGLDPSTFVDDKGFGCKRARVSAPPGLLSLNCGVSCLEIKAITLVHGWKRGSDVWAFRADVDWVGT